MAAGLGFVHFSFGTERTRLFPGALGLRSFAVLLNFLTGEGLHFKEVTSIEPVIFLGGEVAIAGRILYDLSARRRDRFDLLAVWRGDIGGFGVGFELTRNPYGAVGTSLSETTSMEIGYRYLYTDYVTGGFEYDAAMKGVFIGTRIVF